MTVRRREGRPRGREARGSSPAPHGEARSPHLRAPPVGRSAFRDIARLFDNRWMRCVRELRGPAGVAGGRMASCSHEVTRLPGGDVIRSLCHLRRIGGQTGRRAGDREQVTGKRRAVGRGWWVLEGACVAGGAAEPARSQSRAPGRTHRRPRESRSGRRHQRGSRVHSRWSHTPPWRNAYARRSERRGPRAREGSNPSGGIRPRSRSSAGRAPAS